MQISYNILKDFVKIPKNISPEEISLKLTSHTVEVEGFFSQEQKFSGVVVGKVLSVKKHPKADRLNLAEVDIKTEVLNIVCGAPNLEEGQLVPVATIGTVLPGDFEIKESEIRGEKSRGMICAEDELGIGEEHDGIMVLSEKAKPGQSFSSYLKMDDFVFEIDNKSLSNRPDLFGHYGIARELAAIFSLELKPYTDLIKDVELQEGLKELEVKVDKKDVCPRYLGVKLDNIKIKDSPEWLKNKLIAIGQKPINNIVDLGNYVMFELGQPLHIFDANKIDKISVRLAKKNEVIETLDEKERILSEEDIVITDGEKPIAIAGIIGGKDCAVNDKTTSIIIESANFKDYYIRRTSQKISLRTEASIRFEKSLDTKLPEIALKRFLMLLKEISPEANIISNVSDVNSDKNEKIKIEFNFSWIEKKVGQPINKELAIENLQRLGFKLSTEDDLVTVIVPDWRATKDVKIKEDVLEEILRMIGYDNIQSSLPVEELREPIKNEIKDLEREIKNFFALKFSFFEVYNYSFVGEDQLSKLGVDFSRHLRLANPLSANHSILRQSLIGNLVYNIKNNQAKADRLGFFEIGSVFFNNPGNIKKEKQGEVFLPHQEDKLAFILSENSSDLFLEAKGMVEVFISFLTSSRAEAEFLVLENSPAWSDDIERASINLMGKNIGIISSLSDEVLNNFGIKKKTVFVEVSIKDLFDLYKSFSVINFKEISRYPIVTRDLAFVVEEEIMYNDIKNEIVNFSSLINSVDIFDVYQGDKLEKGKKSLAFHISYLSPEKTLTTLEVDELQNSLIKLLEEKFSAKLRDF